MGAKVKLSEAADAQICLFQVFRSRAGEYDLIRELSQTIDPGAWMNLHLDLPNGTGDGPLRMDVTNRPAVCDISAISLRRPDGTVIWTWNPKDVTDALRVEGTAAVMASQNFCRVLSLGDSPHVYLPVFRGAAFEQHLVLEIRLRVDLELAAVRAMNQRWAYLELSRTGVEPGSAIQAENGNPAGSAQLLDLRTENERKIKEIVADAEARLEAMRDDFEQRSAQHALEMEQARRANQAALMERDQMLAQQPGMLQQISIAQRNVEELKAEIERMHIDRAQLEYDLIELRKVNARMSAALEEERAVRAIIQHSISWQLTKPFRVVGGLFGPRKKY